MAKTRRQTSASVIDNPGQPDPTGAAPLPDDSDAPDHRDRIAMRAYELYLARGAADGRDFDDWLAAEREIGHSAGSEEDAGE